jgi:hypothetical protein
VVYDREFLRIHISRCPLARPAAGAAIGRQRIRGARGVVVEAVDVMPRADDSTASSGYPTPVDFGTIAC